jgi:hypothetical protein
MTRKVLRITGGEIICVSAQGRGSTFIPTLEALTGDATAFA